MRKYLLPLAAGALIAAAATAQAASDSATFNVSVTVNKSCTIAATDMDFGPVTNLSGQTATSTVTANCSTGAHYNMGLAASSVTMTGPTSQTITASLAFPAAGTDYTGSGSGQTYTVTGTLPSTGMAPDNGTYTGTATVNINF
jgi:hypothetical protein